jgi:hypothetical protein
VQFKAPQPDNPPTHQIWARVVGVSEGDLDMTVKRFLEIRQLYDDAVDVINSLEINRELFLRWKNPVASVLAFRNFFSSWSEIQSQLSLVTMTELEFAAQELERHAEEKVVPKETIDELSNDISATLQKF